MHHFNSLQGTTEHIHKVAPQGHLNHLEAHMADTAEREWSVGLR